MEMGLSLEESVALFALFEREGIRSETVVRSLRSAFQRLTADGRPLREALADVFTELQTLDREAAVAKGLEIFGTQALDLVDAVRDGRLSVEEFTATLVDGQDSIIGVARETDGWKEALEKVKNFLKLQFEDVAREVFKNVTEFVDGLIPAAQRVSAAFEKDGIEGAFRQLGVEMRKIYEENIQPLFIRFLQFLDETVKPLALALGKEIGSAIASGIASGVVSGLKAIPGVLGGRIRDAFKVPDGPGPERTGTPGSGLTPTDRALLDSLFPAGPMLSSRQTTQGAFSGPSGTLSDISFFAKGGIVTGPTLGVVGEAGPEAIIPLDRAGGIGTTYVTINVSGADPQAVVEALRRYTRANGPLGQVVTV
jgi:hypothetical protein